MINADKSQNKILNKLSAARTRLILDNPFLGSLILQLPLKEASPDWCKTIATDARFFYYNEEYIESLNLSETQFVLSHEALHCGLSHFSRKQHRTKMKWDLACDYAVNGLLLGEDLTAPKGTLYQEAFDGMAAEEIYPSIEDNDDSELLDEHLYDQNNSGNQNNSEKTDEANNGPNKNNTDVQKTRPEAIKFQQQQELSQLWQKRMAGAIQQAKLAGKLSENMSRQVGKLLKPKISWRQLLSEHMCLQAREDYSYLRPSTRRDEDAIFPGLRSHQINLVVALDTSGSVSDKELNAFVSELNAIKGQVRARITILGCDERIVDKNIQTFEPWDTLVLPDFYLGGGGTAFEPVFQWVDKLDIRPDLLIYFTDGKAHFPNPVSYPVIWVIKGKVIPPWGQRIPLNDE